MNHSTKLKRKTYLAVGNVPKVADLHLTVVGKLGGAQPRLATSDASGCLPSRDIGEREEEESYCAAQLPYDGVQ
jgi:hypothetical protein